MRTLSLQAQAPAKEWDKTFGGNSYDYFHSVLQTADGGYLLAGGSSSPISGDKTTPNKGIQSFWVMKTDAAGNKQWEKTYGGDGVEVLRSIIQTQDGGYLLGEILIPESAETKVRPLEETMTIGSCK